MKEDIKYILIPILLCVALIVGVLAMVRNYNSKTHSDDVKMTEWISPDGVHYWYHEAGYTAMLAPRYDANGNLVIDK